MAKIIKELICFLVRFLWMQIYCKHETPIWSHRRLTLTEAGYVLEGVRFLLVFTTFRSELSQFTHTVHGVRLALSHQLVLSQGTTSVIHVTTWINSRKWRPGQILLTDNILTFQEGNRERSYQCVRSVRPDWFLFGDVYFRRRNTSGHDAS